MARSGVAITEEVKEACRKVTASNDKLIGAIFEFSPDNKKIVLSKQIELGEGEKKPFQKVMAELPDDDVRYVLLFLLDARI